MKAIIIGGGIGGMALAVALRQQSIHAEVYEQADALREVGAGLVLWPNAIKAMEALGLVAALRMVSVPFGDSEIRDWHGALLTRLRMPVTDGETGALIYRTQLLDLLAQAFAPQTAYLDARCVSVHQDADGVTAYFADGSIAQGDVLIGADGIHSVVRQKLFGDIPMRYAGYAVWRGTSNADVKQPVGTEMWGRGLRFGYRTTTPGRVYWYATANVPEHYRSSLPHTDGLPERRADLLSRFAGWHTPVAAILQGSENARILYSDIYNVAPLSAWSAGRITLLGDAAHALTPNLGQGACQAIEDAVGLATLLEQAARSHAGSGRISGETIRAALQTYQARRMPRVYAVAARARRLGEIGQWENGLARVLRNEVVKHLPDALQRKQEAWLFRFNINDYAAPR